MNDDQGKAADEKPITCPYCSSSDSEFFSLFGQQLLTMQYYCKHCHTPFEYVKDDTALQKRDASQHPFIASKSTNPGPL